MHTSKADAQAEVDSLRERIARLDVRIQEYEDERVRLEEMLDADLDGEGTEERRDLCERHRYACAAGTSLMSDQEKLYEELYDLQRELRESTR